MIEGIHEYIKIKYIDIKALAIALFKPRRLMLHSNKTAFVMLAANYNNLGDIAITKAQVDFLKHVLPNDYEVVTVPVNETFNVFRSMKRQVNTDTIITLIGGGNSGSLYGFVEWPRRFILKHFSKCRIISFPQTVYFEGGKRGEVLKNEFIRLCKRCTQLTLVAREKQSFDAYQEMFQGSVECLLFPDIVFSNMRSKDHVRDGIALVLRNDMEKQNHGNITEAVKSYGLSRSISVTENDTCDVSINDDGWIGVTGSGSEEIQVNRKDAKAHLLSHGNYVLSDLPISCYKIRWEGYEYYRSSSVNQVWELYLFDNGDAMIRMEKKSTSDGTFSFFGTAFSLNEGESVSFYRTGESTGKFTAVTEVYDITKHVS